MHRIAYGAADVGFPEDTFALTECFTTSSQPGDVAAWSDLWFYSNPIFMEVRGATRVAGVK